MALQEVKLRLNVGICVVLLVVYGKMMPPKGK